MTYEQFNKYCQSLPATEYVIQWGGAHVWKVGGKVFAIGGWEKTSGPAITFKVSDLNYQILIEQAGFRPAPYMASRGMKWVQQYDSKADTLKELKANIKESHRLVALGLTKKRRKELGLD